MSFIVDKQTLEDLNIFGKRGKKSIYSQFNRTSTRGGASLLEQMFRYPLSNAEEINTRSRIIQIFDTNQITFPVTAEWFDAVESYLSNSDERTKVRSDGNTLGRKVNNILGADVEFNSIKNGLILIAKILNEIGSFLNTINKLDFPASFLSEISSVKNLLESEEIVTYISQTKGGKCSYENIVNYDQLIRFNKRSEILKAFDFIYILDVYISVANVSRVQNYSYGVALDNNNHDIHLQNVYHPLVPNAKGNDISITSDKNIVFLTGANMAGKSTFMKSLGISVYLAHVGFPIPAKSMTFGVREGLYTTINLADNLNMGYSHFYAEVVRVKQVSEQLAANKNLFVIFDELFRGTNVKDAYDATIAITEAYAHKRNCMFVVSTHIIEAADELKQRCDNINYVYLPTIMEGVVPKYTYQLTEGVTADRHGMVIINNEQILESLEQGVYKDKIHFENKFITDQQTLDDLNLLGKYKSNSIFSIFNKTTTFGGEKLLEKYFKDPLIDVEKINARSAEFDLFKSLNLKFPIGTNQFSEMESYLMRSSNANIVEVIFSFAKRKFAFLLGLREEYEMAASGLQNTLEGLSMMHEFLKRNISIINDSKIKTKFQIQLDFLDKLNLQTNNNKTNISALDTIKYEYQLHNIYAKEIADLLKFCYWLDVNIAVANVATENKFSRAVALNRSENCLKLVEAYHPSIPKAVSNTISMSAENNLIFLTGANMAGKSTIMKTIGVNYYLGHMGFPVAAESFEFSVKEGIYTSINVPDNIDMGLSHFYAEVLRVKNIAEEVADKKDLLIIFDELFKGTNVKDAFDATLAVSKSFSAYSNSLFIISTHIVEVGEELKKSNQNIQYKFMPTIMDGNRARYPYKIAEGISDDRHGMMIIENEGILGMLN